MEKILYSRRNQQKSIFWRGGGGNILSFLVKFPGEKFLAKFFTNRQIVHSKKKTKKKSNMIFHYMIMNTILHKEIVITIYMNVEKKIFSFFLGRPEGIFFKEEKILKQIFCAYFFRYSILISPARSSFQCFPFASGYPWKCSTFDCVYMWFTPQI